MEQIEINQDLVALASSMPAPERVRELEEFALKMPQVEIKTTHVIHGGMYARTIFVPAGMMITGALLNSDNICIVSGDISVTTDAGVKRLTGFNVIEAVAGFKRIGITHADTYWTMVLRTDKTELEDIENDMTNEADQLQTRRNDLLSHDRQDYLAMLTEYGLTEKIARENSERADNLIELPPGDYKIELGSSEIEGTGLFATDNIKAGEVIAPARIGDNRTIAGRYTNHSAKPNAKMVRRGHKDIDLVALQDIDGGLNGGDGQEITVDYREAYRLAIQISMEN